MTNLIIVESPTKARTLSRFLDKEYVIEATMGHIRDLPEKKLGIEIKDQKSWPKANRPLDEKIKDQNGKETEKIEYDFIPQYQVISGRKASVKELKDKAAKADKVILATDPDREGEAIAYHVREVISSSLKIKNQKSKLDRIVFHEITETAINDALLHAREIDMMLVDAQQARRILDRLVGYKLSPLLWNKLNKRWLSAGRVQSVAVRLIVDREREIEAFKSVEFWQLDARLAQNISLPQESFIARLIKIGEKKAEIKNREEADGINLKLKSALYKVLKVEAKEMRRFPSAPFTTSTMQQTASNRLGWSAKRTIKAAQSLYEVGYITYHRTDSTNIAVEAVSSAREFIGKAFGESYLPGQPKIYKTKSKVAQEAHEAIRPTKITMLAHQDFTQFSPSQEEQFKLSLMPETEGRDGQMLYSLIWRRFLSSQMNEAVFEQTNVDIEANTQPEKMFLRAVGERLKFNGWLVLFGKVHISEEEAQNEEEEQNNNIPKLSPEEILNLLELLSQQKFTQPPARYTEATLIKILEEKGIGRPSTYAPIISTIQDRKYVEKIEKKFHPTDLGKTVNDFLVKHFPLVFDINFTAKMEDELDGVANGQLNWKSVVSEFYSPFIKKIDQVFKEAEKVKVDLGSTDEKCPECGNPLVIRLSKFGKFLACSTFPNCKFTKNLIEKAGIKCPKCNGEIIVKKTRMGKQFYGCENYPKCTFAAWKKEDIK